jgi:hypothetical protein
VHSIFLRFDICGGGAAVPIHLVHPMKTESFLQGLKLFYGDRLRRG